MSVADRLNSDRNAERRRVLYALAVAVLLASAGFAAVFVIAAWLPYGVVAWFSNLSPATRALLARVPASTTIPFLATLPVIFALAGMMAARKKGRAIKRSDRGF